MLFECSYKTKRRIQPMENKPVLYKMCLKFVLTLGLKSINDITAKCGLTEKLVVKDALTIKMTQTVPFILTEKIISEYARTIKKSYESKEFTCEECKFDGYEYIYQVDPENASDGKKG